MAELSCQQCHELTAELALGVLEGRERADALAHLHRCPRCQDRVSAMATTADRLVELLPDAEPPPGFEQRVVAAITASAPAPAGYPAWWRTPATAMALTGALLTGGGWLFGQHQGSPGWQASTPNGQPTQVLVAALRSGGHEFGRAYIYPENPSWVLVSISEDNLGAPGGTPGPSPASASTVVNCELVRQDGSTIALGSFPLHAGHIDWATRASVDRGSLVGAKITTTTGNTLASAVFTPATPPTAGSTVTGQRRDQPQSGGAERDLSEDEKTRGENHRGDDKRGDDKRGDRHEDRHDSNRHSDDKNSDDKNSDDKNSGDKNSGDKHDSRRHSEHQHSGNRRDRDRDRDKIEQLSRSRADEQPSARQDNDRHRDRPRVPDHKPRDLTRPH